MFGFGQNDVFNKQPKISFLQSYKAVRTSWEKWTKIFLKVVMQVPYGRFWIMPYPRPITVVGKFQGPRETEKGMKERKRLKFNLIKYRK